MSSFIRSLRAPLRASFPKTAARPIALRPFSVSALVKAGGPAPPQLYGPGGKAGEIASDEEQATGLERFELLGDLHGVDVFDMKPIEMTRMGTLDEPIPIFTLTEERLVGCTGFPADSHDTLWLRCNVSKDKHRCPECGCVYALDFKGDPSTIHQTHGSGAAPGANSWEKA